MVQDLEQEAERMIQDATLKSGEEKSKAMEAANDLIQRIRDEALQQAGRIQSETSAQLERELAEVQSRFRLRMDEKLQRAKSKMKEAVQLILHSLAGK
jgi:vacuolar-type H+-ATPase subunit H